MADEHDTDPNDRHQELEGWDELKVKNTNLTIVGSGPLANYLGTYVAGLGFGKVRIVSNEIMDTSNVHEFLISSKPLGNPKSDYLKEELQRLNPELSVVSKNVYVDKQDVGQNTVEFLVDVTNNPDSKMRCIQIAEELKQEGKNIQYFMSASSSKTKASLAIYKPETNVSILNTSTIHDIPQIDTFSSPNTDSLIESMIAGSKKDVSNALKQSSELLEDMVSKTSSSSTTPRQNHGPLTGIDDDLWAQPSTTENEEVFMQFKTKERKKYDMQSPVTYLMEEYADEGQGSVTSGVIAAMIIDEIRKAVIPRESEIEKDKQEDIYIKFGTEQGSNGTIKILDNRLDYNLQSNERFSFDDDIPRPTSFTRDELKDKKIGVIGLGGIGTYAVLNLAIMGVGEIYAIEPDEIEGSNYNRQFLYVGHNGKNKADVMKKQLEIINPQTTVYPSVEWVKEDTLDRLFGDKNIDLLLGCVDNWEARVHINNFAVKHNIPYIDGSLDPFHGRVESYTPGETSCLNCQSNYFGKMQEAKAKEEEKFQEGADILHKQAETNPKLRKYISTPKGLAKAVREEYVCRNRSGSIVVSNALVGTMMAAEALTHLMPSQYSNPLHNKLISYKSDKNTRLDVRKAGNCACDRVEEAQRCDCHNYKK